MSAKKKSLQKKNTSKVEETLSPYAKREIKIFHSHKEEEDYKLQQMALLTSEENLQHLRKLINIAYGMHGYDPDNLPKKHTVKIIQRG